jgi:hypothetical protein
MTTQTMNTAPASRSVHTNGAPAVKYPAPNPVNTAVVALIVAKPMANDASLPTERSSFWVYPNWASRASSSSLATCVVIGTDGAVSVIGCSRSGGRAGHDLVVGCTEGNSFEAGGGSSKF